MSLLKEIRGERDSFWVFLERRIKEIQSKIRFRYVPYPSNPYPEFIKNDIRLHRFDHKPKQKLQSTPI